MKKSSPYSKNSKPFRKGGDPTQKGSWYGFLKGVVLANIVIVVFMYITGTSLSDIMGVDSGAATASKSVLEKASTGASTLLTPISDSIKKELEIMRQEIIDMSMPNTPATHETTANTANTAITVINAAVRPPLPDCTDPVWCSIPMPKKSYYNFDVPSDPYRWKQAQLQAASGEQVLLRRVVEAFPNHFDFLDGDITFRKQHLAMDFFVDEINDLSPLLPPGSPDRRRLDLLEGGDGDSPVVPFATTSNTFKGVASQETSSRAARSVVKKRKKGGGGTKKKVNVEEEEEEEEDYTSSTVASMVNGKLQYPWELRGRRVIPDPYDFRTVDRAPIVSICGYTAYRRDSQTYFSGNRVGGAFIDRKTFFKHWRKVKDKIDTPFIAVCALNENWGFVSSNFPNRTAGWGQCCNVMPRDKEVWDFLNHPKTLALVINQHSNISHPKMLTLPRGLPTTWGSTRVLIWDMQRQNLKKVRKNKLLFAATSSWGPRPQILQCISDKMKPKDFDGHVKNPKGARLSREAYYEKLTGARFGLGLPGLGYDTFRAWELMTMGTIVVLEKAVGFDRSMYRLPALLLEDFDLIKPETLREAYVEAMYRADEFEYKRLTQSFWYSTLLNISVTKSTTTLTDTFPMSAEEPNFSRPRVPFGCWKKGSSMSGCGKGTKRPPASSC